MATIKATFSLVDEMSAKLEKVAQTGRNALSQWENSGNSLDKAFDKATTKTAKAASTIDSVNSSTRSVTTTTDSLASALDKEATRLEKVALNARLKADMDKRMADRAREYYEEIKDRTDAEGKFTEELNKSAQAALLEADRLEKAAEASNKKADAAERAASATRDNASETAKAADALEKYGNESEQAGKKSQKFGDDATEAIQSVEDLLVTVGITKLLKSIGDAFVDCVGDAIEFESAITGVYKTVDGTPEQLAQISDEVKDLALNIPATTTEIAAVAEAAGQLGIATENVMAFSEVMINLGEATNLTSDEAASALAKFTNITGTSAEEYENLGSTIVALGNNFATTEADIVAMSTRMASAGTLAGMTESDILALAASLSSVGIEADAGGSSMSTLISKMQLAVETGNEQLEQFASVAGYSADEFTKKWGEDAAQALYAFIAGLQDTERNGMSATAVLDDMGITEIRLSNAIKALSNNSDSLGQALTFASGAWEENTALATEANTRYATLESKLGMTKNAANNLSIAVGDVFTPAISKAAEVGQTALESLTSIAKEHPEVVKALAAITAGLAAYTAGVTAHVAVKKLLTIAQRNFNAAAFANPYVLLATGVAAVVTACVLFADKMGTAQDRMEQLTATSKKHESELNALKSEYESVCDTYGETSYQAQELSWKIESLTAEYEASKKTLGEYIDEHQKLEQSWKDNLNSRNEAVESVEKEGDSIYALVNRLDQLTSASDLSSTEQAELLAVIDGLNKKVPQLSLSYDTLTGKMSSTKEAILAIADAEIKSKKVDTISENLRNALEEKEKQAQKRTEDLEEQADAQRELNRLQESYSKWYEEHKYSLNSTKNASKMGQYMAKIAEAQEQVDTFTAAVEADEQAMANAEAQAEEFAQKLADLGYASLQQVENSKSVESAIDNMCSSLEGLKASYDEAYTAAKASFDGQFSLFDEAKADMESTVSKAQEALNSQLEYWKNYADNVNVLRSVSAEDLGVTKENYDALMSYVQDGSEQAAGLAKSMVDAINSGNQEAITKLANTVGEVQAKRDEAADAIANWQIDFDEKVKKIIDSAKSAVEKLDLDGEATKAAKSTFDAYAETILSQGAKAVSNAKSIASQIKSALNINASVNVGTSGKVGKGYASGTDYATAGVHLVGEHGPELVEFAGGEKVYTADETEGILARSAAKEFYATPQGDIGKSETPKDSDGPKIIRLEINGAGAIEVDENVDEATVVAIMQQHLKPVLTSIVKQEIYEEGDLSYDY